MASIITRLKPYGACDVSQVSECTDRQVADALTRLKVPGGGFLSGLSLRSPSDASAKIIGRAHTVLFKRNTVAHKEKNFQGHYVSSYVHAC